MATHPRSARLAVRALESRAVPSAGVLDPAFDTDGLAFVSAAPFQADLANGIALQSDGKIVLAGTAAAFSSNNAPLLVRLNANGSPDPTFSGDGVATVPAAVARGGFNQVVQQPDGMLVGVGTADVSGNGRLLVARFQPDGTLDPTFGTGGAFVGTTAGELGYAVTLDGSGRIVVGGSGPNSSGSRLLLARFNTDGTPDATFDGDGEVVVDLGPAPAIVRSVLVQADGKVVGAGNSSFGSGSFVVVRRNSDGTADTTFDTDGLVQTVPPNTGFHGLSQILQQPDGRLLAGGIVADPSAGNVRPALLRYNPNGSLDTSLGGTGYMLNSIGNPAGIGGIALQPNGQVVAVGGVSIPGGSKSIVMRYNADGSLDLGFAAGAPTVAPGVVVTDLAAGDNDSFSAVVRQPNGRIVAAGTAGAGTVRRLGVARYQGDQPIAADDAYSTDEDVALSVGSPGVTANDTNLQSGPPVVLLQGPAHAAAFALNPDGSFDYTPAANFNGTDAFTYRLGNGPDASLPATVTLTVRAVNDPPELSGVPATPTAVRGQPLTFIASATDLEGGFELTFSLDGAPDGAVIDPTTGAFTWTAAAEPPDGVYVFDVRVTEGSDPTLTTSQTITVTLTTPPNTLPTPAGTPGLVEIDEHQTLTFTVTATDPDFWQPLSFSLVGAPAGASVDADTGEFNWTPTEVQGPAAVQFNVRVSDGVGHTDRPVTVFVRELNVAPTLAPLPAAVDTVAGAAVNFTARAADPDLLNGVGNALTYSLVGAPPTAFIDPDTGLFHWSPEAGTPLAPYTFKVRVADDGVPAKAHTQAVTIAVHSAVVRGEDLLVGGTAGDDTITVVPTPGGKTWKVTRNRVSLGSFPAASVTGRVVAHGLGGNDRISVSPRLDKPADLHGGAGNDTLIGGTKDDRLFGGADNDRLLGGKGNDVLVGGAGNDVLLAGVGTNVLIGGAGADRLTGGVGDDLLVGGTTNLDLDPTGLTNILAEWRSGRSYQARIDHLTGLAGGDNLGTFLTTGVGGTVSDEGGKDVLTGGRGADWFLSGSGDKADRKGDEQVLTV